MCSQVNVNCENVLLISARSTVKESKSHKRLNELQGLRGVAIIGVLLFHIWPKKFTAGFLGVDTFFVISGYLMCMLLSRNAPIQLVAVVDFYFRRLKRIFPTYLFVLLFTLFAGWLLLSPTDYLDLYGETFKPLIIAANVPENSKNDYFAQSQSRYNFLTHMWSLSVELQFYLFVPFLVFCLHRLPTRYQFVSISILAITSFCIQLRLTKDYEHMALVGRVWQFMLGFLAHYISDLQQNGSPTNGVSSNSFTGKLSFLGNFAISFASILATLIKPTPYKQVNRLIVSVLSMAVIARPEKNQVLNSHILVYLGDISYSVYLIHWPLLKWYQYMNVELFAYGNGTTFTGGVFLVVAFIFFGQLIEEFFKAVNKFLIGWKTLLFAIFLLYALIIGMLCQLRGDAIDLSFDVTKRPQNPGSILQKAIDFYDNFDDPKQMSKMESIQWTHDFSRAAHNRPWYCDSSELPANNTQNTSALGRLAQTACVVRRSREDKKVIVLFGNSHARMYLPGIIHHFEGVFSEITLFNHNGCAFEGTKDNDPMAKSCSKERKAIIPLLRNWSKPIDIIIFAQAYTPNIDPPLRGKVEKDKVFIEMQRFFDTLSDIAREVVFVPQVHFYGGIPAFNSVYHRKLVMEQPLEVFRTPIEFVKNHRIHTRRRVDAIECKRCLKYDLTDVWCRALEGVCDSVDLERKISFFTDSHHVNMYGSMFVGEYFRTLYDEWIQDDPKSSSQSKE